MDSGPVLGVGSTVSAAVTVSPAEKVCSFAGETMVTCALAKVVVVLGLSGCAEGPAGPTMMPWFEPDEVVILSAPSTG
jgi:hypothetical protein